MSRRDGEGVILNEISEKTNKETSSEHTQDKPSPKKSNPIVQAFQANPEAYRIQVFAVLLLGILFAAHAWATFSQSYCTYCFRIYLSFFSVLGAVIFTGLAAYQPGALAHRRDIWIILLVLLIAGGVGLSRTLSLGNKLIDQPLALKVGRIEVPRVKNLSLQSGTIPLYGLVENYFGLTYEGAIRSIRLSLQAGVMIALGITVGLMCLMIAWLWTRRKKADGLSYTGRLWIVLMVFGLVLSPTIVLGGGYTDYDCQGIIPAATSSASFHLNTFIPEGSVVYWGTGLSPAVLLQVPGIKIYPAQLNSMFSYRIGGEPDAMAAYGLWNRNLAKQWLDEAHVVVLSGMTYKDPTYDWVVNKVEHEGYREIASSPPLHTCNEKTNLLIFIKK